MTTGEWCVHFGASLSCIFLSFDISKADPGGGLVGDSTAPLLLKIRWFTSDSDDTESVFSWTFVHHS